MRCRWRKRGRAGEIIAVRPFPVAGVASDRLGVYGDEERDQSRPADAQTKRSGGAARLPVVAGKGKPLIMRAWTFGEPLGAGVWGIREPKPQAAEVEPDILIVPLLAFDRRGHRIGYGAGYYDMTIAALRAKKPILAVGIAYAQKSTPCLPPRDAAWISC